MVKIRFEKTKGTEKDYSRFVELFYKLGIKITPIKDLEINLDFGEEE